MYLSKFSLWKYTHVFGSFFLVPCICYLLCCQAHPIPLLKWGVGVKIWRKKTLVESQRDGVIIFGMFGKFFSLCFGSTLTYQKKKKKVLGTLWLWISITLLNWLRLKDTFYLCQGDNFYGVNLFCDCHVACMCSVLCGIVFIGLSCWLVMCLSS